MFTITGEIVTPEGVLSGGAVTIDDSGRIAEVGAGRGVSARSGDIEAPGCVVLPGFLDPHIHGGGGADFMHGTVDAVRQVARTHARFGTTGLLATTLTASGGDTEAAIRAARDVAEAGPGPGEARVLGVHLEGPYLCAARRGAQPLAWVRPPDPAEMAHWLEIGGGLIRKLTLAPELAGAETLVRQAQAAGVTVSAGHTDATAAQVEAAVGWGLTGTTHVFNAMRGLHHREPGTVGAALTCPEIVCEVIADGVHLHPQVVRLILTAKGPQGVVLITDAMEGTGMPAGEFFLGGQAVQVQDGVASFADGTLAGSVLTMSRALANLRAFADVSLPDAAVLSSGNAARQMGLDTQFGAIAPGRTADLVVLHPQTGEALRTLVGGQTAWQA